jgi:hypothetical protein
MDKPRNTRPYTQHRLMTQDPKEWKRFGARILELTGGEDVDIVF